MSNPYTRQENIGAFWRKHLRDAIIIIIGIYLVFMFLQRDMASGEAPPLGGETIQRNYVHLAEEGTYLVYFWGSWCPSCKVTTAAINDLSRQYNVISVAIESGTRAEQMQYMRKHHYAFPVLEATPEITAQWGADRLPAIFIISNGKIRFKTMGVTSSWGLSFRLWLTQLLYS